MNSSWPGTSKLAARRVARLGDVPVREEDDDDPDRPG